MAARGETVVEYLDEQELVQLLAGFGVPAHKAWFLVNNARDYGMGSRRHGEQMFEVVFLNLRRATLRWRPVEEYDPRY